MTDEGNSDDEDTGRTSNLLGLFSPPLGRVCEKGEKGEYPDGDAAPGPEYQSFDMLRSYDDVFNAHADMEAPAGSISYMMGLFSANDEKNIAPAPVSSEAATMQNGLNQRPGMGRQKTEPRANRQASPPSKDTSGESEHTPLLDGSSSSSPRHSKDSSWKEKFPVNSTDATPKRSARSRKRHQGVEGMRPANTQHIRLPSVAMPLPAIEEAGSPQGPHVAFSTRSGTSQSGFNLFRRCIQEASKPSTWIGSFMYLLYHVVFCLALGSAIIRPNSSTSILGLMTKTAAIGTISSSAIYWYLLGSEIPALYPTADLFLAPFLANLALKVDAALAKDDSILEEDNDTIFLVTFTFLAGLGICFSGTLLSLSGVFRLANLGSFLPFPVICGFFSAVGILTWTLAVTVDTGGKSVGSILMSGDPALLLFTAIHHIPSVVIASIMKYLGPKNPFFVVMVVFGTIGLFYGIMFGTGVSLEEAKDMGWFWSRSELVYEKGSAVGFQEWAPPAPFGVLNQIFRGNVHWQAVWEGMSTAIALGFLYLIRCSVHGAALKKNIPNLSRSVGSEIEESPIIKSPKLIAKPISIRMRKFSEAVDIEAVMQPVVNGKNASKETKADVCVVHARPTNISLKSILMPYGLSQFVAAFVGGFSATPSVAASSTMFSLGADGIAPQVGSVLLLLVFYMTDFQLVQYIPKPAFSSMLVLAFIDMIYTWFYKSYFKTKDKSEWLVVPAIVVCAFVFDLLSAVFLGIAFSTFIFVASFFRSGVVRYVANASVVHSTIERPFRRIEWLQENGDFIQILVLQNYLFFGNASAVYNFIATMFERSENDDGEEYLLARKPKYLVMDVALVTGMDTSTVDIFNEIRNLCSSNQCKLFITGCSASLRGVLGLGGFKPETLVRSKRKLRFFASLDAALGKAEDHLLDTEYDAKETSPNDGRLRLLSEGDFGFRTALRHIDEEHGDNFSLELVDLQKHTKLVELSSGDRLYGQDQSRHQERGLFFIEAGVLKIEHETGTTLTRGANRTVGNTSKSYGTSDSLSKIQAMEYSNILSASRGEVHTFRSARIGPGWIAGTIEAVSGAQRPGEHVAVTHCRLHHLPFSKIQQVEKSNPALVLSLYKLLAHMMARRQEATIGQLATLHSIMSSPANSQII